MNIGIQLVETGEILSFYEFTSQLREKQLMEQFDSVKFQLTNRKLIPDTKEVFVFKFLGKNKHEIVSEGALTTDSPNIFLPVVEAFIDDVINELEPVSNTRHQIVKILTTKEQLLEQIKVTNELKQYIICPDLEHLFDLSSTRVVTNCHISANMHDPTLMHVVFGNKFVSLVIALRERLINETESNITVVDLKVVLPHIHQDGCLFTFPTEYYEAMSETLLKRINDYRKTEPLQHHQLMVYEAEVEFGKKYMVDATNHLWNMPDVSVSEEENNAKTEKFLTPGESFDSLLKAQTKQD